MDREQQFMALWKSTFHDSDEFIHLYFSRKYRFEHLRFYEKAGDMVSAFLALPYPFLWLGKEFCSLYISGACTGEEYRNRGIMSRLIEDALVRMHREGVPFSTLIPAEEWLFGYYEKLGYATVFFSSTEEYHLPAANVVYPPTVQCPQRYDADFVKHLFPYFDRKTRERSCGILHPSDDYEAILEECYLSGGRLAAYFCPQSGKPTGWAMAQVKGNQVEVKELLCDTQQERQALLTYFADLWKISKVVCRTTAPTVSSTPYGMIRITDVLQVLKFVAQQQPDLAISIEVSDSQIAQNTGLYILSGGECRKETAESRQASLNIDVNTLSLILFGQREIKEWPLGKLQPVSQPYMNLMID